MSRVYIKPLQLLRIERNCEDEGLEVMGEVLGILWNRESVSAEVLLNASTQAYELYEMFIGPAIDELEKALKEK